MKKVEEAVEILQALGLPPAQQNERSALTLLALAGLGRRSRWTDASQELLRTVDVMERMRERFGKHYKPNSRETIRRQTLHQFEQARIADRNPDDPSRPTNSGKNCYALSDAVLPVIRAYGTADFDDCVDRFIIAELGSLRAAYSKRRESDAVPLNLPDGSTLALSPGKHNALQAAIIEEMGPRFAPGAHVLYVGDTAKKYVLCDDERLRSLSVEITEHGKLPDVILYFEKKNWLLLIEAVTSHGPINPKRHHELEELFAESSPGRVYVTAFLTRADFRKHAAEIAWETEVWIAENPGHMIHFNGPKFLGPYDSANAE